MVETRSKNYLTIALEEVAQGKIEYHYAADRAGPAMARLLLGVSGGIAAYKAWSWRGWPSRPVTPCASSRRQASAVRRRGDVRRHHRRARPRHEWSATRCAAPSRATRRPSTRRSRHLALVQHADAYLIAPASANTWPSSPQGLADNLLTERRAGRRCPVARRPGDERPHVRAPGHAGQPRARCASAASTVIDPASARSPPAASTASGRLPEPAELLAAVEARLGARRPAAARRPAGCSSPPAARASRSTPCASSATARRAAWASRWPRRPPAAAPSVTVVAANVALPRQPGVEYVDVRDRGRARRRLRGALRRRATCC